MRLFGTLVALVGFALASCSGGGGGSPTSPPASALPPPPPPTLATSLSAPSSQLEAKEGDRDVQFSFDVTYTGTSSDPVILDLTYDQQTLQIVGDVEDRGSNTFRVTFELAASTQPDMPGGLYAGDIQMRLCADQSCTTEYPGSSTSFDYSVLVKLDDWVTYQRNSTHNAYVNTSIDPTQITYAWTWPDPNPNLGLSRATSAEGKVFTTQSSYGVDTKTYALDEQTGAEIWHYSLGVIHSASSPAYVNGNVVITSMATSSTSNPQTVLDAATGIFARSMSFASQWAAFLAVTPFDDHFYASAGYVGNVTYAYDVNDVSPIWTANGSGGEIWNLHAPAVDEDYVYYYSGQLDVFDRVDGSLVQSIPDPFYVANGSDYFSAPIIADSDTILAYSGSISAGIGDLESGYSTRRPIVSYSKMTGAVNWRTQDTYRTQPAVADGMIYAATNAPARFDAIDLGTGAVMWSWTPPLPDDSFHCDTVVTNNLVFVSTTSHIYAIDLNTRQQVWSHDSAGCLTITPDHKLIIVEGRSVALQSNGRMVAYDLLGR